MRHEIVTLLFLLVFCTVSFQAQSQNQQQKANDQTKNQANHQSSGFYDSDMKKLYDQAIRGMIDSKLEYYETTDAVDRIAKLNKKYYDSLIKAGFTEEQALKIVIEHPLNISSDSK
jgi:cell division protein FtsB